MRELHASLDAHELVEWMSFDRLEPIGGTAADLRAGIIAATIANSTPRKSGSKPLAPEDFMPARQREKKVAWSVMGFDQQADIVAERLLARFGAGSKKES